MNTLEINDILSNLGCFYGVYPKDLLPKSLFKKRPLAFVINTDNADEPGEHWVALYIDENNIAEYLDSFGFPPFKKIYEFLEIQNVENLIYNNYQLQSNFSSVCGA